MKAGNADLSREAWCSKIQRGHGVLIEPSAATDVWEEPENSEIFKMCILQIVLLTGKRD